MSPKKALERYYENQLRELAKAQRPKRRNGKPEQLVKQQVMAWLKKNGFAVNAIEARAVYSRAAGRYVSGMTDPGVSDILGCAPNGVAVAIELKAPGKRSTLKQHQRDFLMANIKLGGFAVCVDSVQCLENIWKEYAHRRLMEPELSKALLYRHLPPEGHALDGEW